MFRHKPWVHQKRRSCIFDTVRSIADLFDFNNVYLLFVDLKFIVPYAIILSNNRYLHKKINGVMTQLNCCAIISFILFVQQGGIP